MNPDLQQRLEVARAKRRVEWCRAASRSTIARPATQLDKLAGLQLCERLVLMLELLATDEQALASRGEHQLAFVVVRDDGSRCMKCGRTSGQVRSWTVGLCPAGHRLCGECAGHYG